MIAVALAALALVVQQPPTRPDSTRRDTTRASRIGATAGVADTSSGRSASGAITIGRGGDPIPITPELRANAYRSAEARSLVARARAARATQDSLLQNYEAVSVERMSIGARLKATGRDRLAARGESATRIRWQRGVGAEMEVQGARFTAPVVSPKVEPLNEPMMGAPSSIPYYPGREALWPMGDATLWKHPLAPDAEAYYRYSLGDSLTFTLADGRAIRLRELRLEPRHARSDLVTGSFWFDTESAQLVRAIYRPAVPLDMQATFSSGEGSNTPEWLRPLLLTIHSVSVEFGLHEGRWWLPRRHAVDGEARVTFARLPISVDQRFTYSSVNGLDPIAFIASQPVDPAVSPRTAMGDSAWRALPMEERSRLASAARDERLRRRKEACETVGYHTSTTVRDSVPVRISIPCDSATLVSSPALPPSIFTEIDDPLESIDPGLLERALGWGSQADWSWGTPEFAYGLDLVRYNRVEGLSIGAMLQQEMGKGFDARLVGRVGIADLHPRGELAISRADAFRTVSLTAYERLGVATDWGSPLDLGASLNALLFGRDEGLYYGARGLELTGHGLEGSRFSWRLFAEQHRPVDVETNFSLPNVFNGLRFRENIVAERGDVLGAGVRLQGSRGDDPRRLRLLGDLRGEGATGDFDYARAMLDVTLSRELFSGFAASVTGAAGSSVGVLPTQKLWYLGGVHTVRGQPLAAMAGDAFWMTRGELGFGIPLVRPSLFYDLGWAGDRDAWSAQGRPITGAGIGLSVLDGLLRLDVAKGIRPNRGIRADLTLEARF